MKQFFRIRVFPMLLMSLVSMSGMAQTSSSEIRYNPITTAVPFLTITPDSRHGAMGDVGVATSPDANAQYWNPSKLAFIDDKLGFSLSFTPWLRQLVNDVNLAYVAGYLRLNSTQTIGASLRYFSMGEIQLTDQNGTNLATVKPNEFALDFSYSRKLSDYFSGGVALRYIRSDLSGGIGSNTYVPGNAFASDVSFYYNRNVSKSEKNRILSAGINLSNIGSRISYDNGSTKEYLPANMKLGGSYTTEFNSFNTFSVSLDFNKLLVPTPQLGTGANNTSKPVISSIFSSLGDAPGGLKEEFQEINYSLGAEYWYDHKFAIRTGYFNENQYKGNRKFFSTGLGIKMNIASIDFAYLIPVNQNNPLANTIRFTLHFNLKDAQNKKDKAAPEAAPILPEIPTK
ncbi:MAG: type IX secretion system outer membrane channel protein PorV [Prolixibacteraceae bacterium]